MKIKKASMFLILLLISFFIVCQSSLVKADIQTSIPVNGTLYPVSNTFTPSKPVSPSNPVAPIKTEAKPSGFLGKFGDSGSGLISLGGLMLVLAAIGVAIERRI